MNEIKEISEQERTIGEDIEEYVGTLRRIPGCDDCENNNVMKWLQCNKDDGDIIDKNFTQAEMANERNEDVPSHGEAFEPFEIRFEVHTKRM